MQKTYKKDGLRIPPQSIESEKAILGSILLKKDVMYDALDVINEESFYVDKHRVIFEAMNELFNKGDAIDVLTVSERLKDKKKLDKAGGAAYLSQLVNSVPSAANARHYGAVVQKKAFLRRLIEASDSISEMAYDEENELDDILDASEKKIFAATSAGTARKLVPLSETLEEAWERIENLHNSKENGIRGVPTGFTGLDNKLAGFQNSDLIILAARPSVGKTSLALDIARQAACKHDAKVAIFSLEMGVQQLVDRMLSAEAKVDSWKLRTGRIDNDTDFENIQNALAQLSQAPIFIEDESATNVINIRSVCRKLKSENGLDLVVIDYLQLIHPTRHYDSMVNQVTEISRALKGLARELDIPVLALSQLSRAVEQRGGRPRLSDLRDSGSIEQDADVVMFIHREDKNNRDQEPNNMAEILIEKHRNGPTGVIELYFDEKKTSFMNIDTSERGSGDDFDSF